MKDKGCSSRCAKLRPSFKVLLILIVFSFFPSMILAGQDAYDQDAYNNELLPNRSAIAANESEVVPSNKLMSFVVTDVSIESALQLFAEKARVGLSFKSAMLPDRKISVSISAGEPHEVLYSILEGTDLSPKLTPERDVLVIQQSDAEEEQFVQSTVSGVVTDAQTGDPIPGVNILVQGTTASGTTTDVDGNFELNVSSFEESLVISYIGYISQVVELNGRNEIEIQLEAAVTSLDDIVVVGYGEQRRRDLTGSISTVQAENIQNTSSLRPDEAILGRVAGVAVSQNSGEPGGDVTIRVRGTNSITASSEPLFVVDGVVGAGDLNTISPDDIETITVLKDASATAIYGSRGAGGVIMITTKRGLTDSAPTISYRSSIGIQQVSKELDLLNATEYAELYNATLAAQGLPPAYADPASFGTGTDWQDEIYRSAVQHNHSLSVRGGGENTRYMLSGNYLDQDGIVMESYFNRGGLRFNLDSDVGERVTIGTSASMSRAQGNPVGGQVVRNALLQPPINPIYDEDGNYYQFVIPNIPSDNPVAQASEIDRKNTISNVFGNVYGNISILEQLDFRINLSATTRSAENKVYFPSYLQTASAVDGRAQINTSSRMEMTMEGLLTYQQDFDRHSVTTLLGYTVQERRTEEVSTGATNFTTDKLGYNNLQGGAVSLSPTSSVDSWGLESYLFRANYGFDDKYLITTTARLDGSSKFGVDNRYGFFPSAAVAWVVSEESFFDVSVVDDFRVRTSYGLTGNEGIGSYVSRARMTTNTTVYGNTQQIGFRVQSVANPNLKWESTSQLDIGLEVALLNNRLSMTADWYDKITDDLLLNVEVPAQTGFTSSLQNIGSVKNTGFEFAINSRNIANNNFIWSSNFNITFNSNEVLEIGGEDEIVLNVNLSQYSNMNNGTVRLVKGEPLGSIYGYLSDGLFQSQAEVDNSFMSGVEVGDEKFIDANGDGVFTTSDKVLIGNGQPKFFGGIGNSFYYSGFELDAFFTYEYGFDILNSTAGSNSTGWAVSNEMGFLRDRWTPENTDTEVPRARFGGHVSRVSDRFIEDGSYIRFQNLTIAYNLPRSILGQWADNFKVYFTGTNLLTVTGYSGYDPMINNQGGSNVAFSIDYQPYPNARQYTMGVNIDF
ncbi:MAG: TonB-dependent receptor [Balneolaceae bacterium]